MPSSVCKWGGGARIKHWARTTTCWTNGSGSLPLCKLGGGDEDRVTVVFQWERAAACSVCKWERAESLTSDGVTVGCWCNGTPAGQNMLRNAAAFEKKWKRMNLQWKRVMIYRSESQIAVILHLKGTQGSRRPLPHSALRFLGNSRAWNVCFGGYMLSTAAGKHTSPFPAFRAIIFMTEGQRCDLLKYRLNDSMTCNKNTCSHMTRYAEYESRFDEYELLSNYYK